jgi:histidyl-tRNA synthetase
LGGRYDKSCRFVISDPACGLYPEPAKIKKQMDYANKRGVPYVVLIGETEMASGKLTLKNMSSGEQEQLGVEEIAGKLGII